MNRKRKCIQRVTYWYKLWEREWNRPIISLSLLFPFTFLMLSFLSLWLNPLQWLNGLGQKSAKLTVMHTQPATVMDEAKVKATDQVRNIIIGLDYVTVVVDVLVVLVVAGRQLAWNWRGKCCWWELCELVSLILFPLFVSEKHFLWPLFRPLSLLFISTLLDFIKCVLQSQHTHTLFQLRMWFSDWILSLLIRVCLWIYLKWEWKGTEFQLYETASNKHNE